MHVRTGDLVEVISGADKGKRGKVLSVNREKQRVVVQSVRTVFKHIRRSQQNPQGGRVEKEGPIHLSNVMLVCEKTNKPSRIRKKFLKDGSKVRISVRSGETVGAYGKVNN